ncbi:alpha/beta hydrolase [Sphingobacterium pedocola]|uniref:XynC protein n=1 Tax=Sphingobacterium pedocola TaxID=2082722 RepID=A0ABR9T7C8_9SPHI|nr:alpha/beta hydrolase family protein [Sphingobacterium pedocola]MBE8720979.1 XynC protein [Sphingobacterium pedocola]
MKNVTLLILFIAGLSTNVFSAKVDTVEVHSAAMRKNIKTVIIRPEVNSGPAPTLYLLHGYSGNYSNWVNNAPYIKKLVDFYGYNVVCPDGGFNSWYWDIDGDNNYQYETFISKELVEFVEKNYSVRAGREARAITGLSMGGHGALYLAIRHQDVFGAAGSTAGGIDIRPFPNNWDMADRLGTYANNREAWDKHTVIELIHLIQPGNLQLIIDCGTGDFFYDVNVKFHEQLTYMNIPHTFISMPGKHNFDYWAKSIQVQMAYFDDFFRS